MSSMFAGHDAAHPERHQHSRELIDAYAVELDPVVDGFLGVVVELYVLEGAVGGSGPCKSQGKSCEKSAEVHEFHPVYEVRQSALGSGNNLAVFSSRDEGLARAVFAGGIPAGGLGAPACCAYYGYCG